MILGRSYMSPGARPTKHISIEFEIRWKFKTLWCKIFAADHNDILHTSRQWHCRDMCKIWLWSAANILHQSVLNFHRISNSIEICLVGRAPGLHKQMVENEYVSLIVRKMCSDVRIQRNGMSTSFRIAITNLLARRVYLIFLIFVNGPKIQPTYALALL